MSLSSATSVSHIMAASTKSTPERSTKAADPRLMGVLTVVVIRAKNLPDKSIVGKQSPYVTFQFGQERRKTKVKVKGGQHPVFDEEVRFNIYEDAEDILERSRTDDPSPSTNNNPLTTSTSSASNASFPTSTSISTVSSTSFTSIPASSSVVGGNGAGNGKGFRRSQAKKSMSCAIFADDSKEPRLVGETVVDLGKVLSDCEHDDWYTLMYKDRYAGEVSLELTYFINSAPPIPKKVAKPIVRPDYGGPGIFHPSSSSSLPSRDPRRHLASASMANLRQNSPGPISPGGGMSACQSYSHGPGAAHRMSLGNAPLVDPGRGDWAMQRLNGNGMGVGGGIGNLGVIDEMGGRVQPRRGSFSGATHSYGTYPSAQQQHHVLPDPYDSRSLNDAMNRMSVSTVPSSGYQSPPPPGIAPNQHSPAPHPDQYQQQHRHSLPGMAPHANTQWNASGTGSSGNNQDASYSSRTQAHSTYYAPPNLPQPPGVRPTSQYIPPSTSFPQLAQVSGGTFSPPPSQHGPPAPPLAHAYPSPGASAGAPPAHQPSSYNMPGAFPTSSTPVPTSSFPQLIRPTPPPTALQSAPPAPYRNSYPYSSQSQGQPDGDMGGRSTTPLPLIDNRPPMTLPVHDSGPPPLPPASTRPPSTVPGYYNNQYPSSDGQQSERPLPSPTPTPNGYANVGTTLPLAGFAPPAQVPYEDPYIPRTPSMSDPQGGRYTPVPYQGQVPSHTTSPQPSHQYQPYNPPAQHYQQQPPSQYPQHAPPPSLPHHNSAPPAQSNGYHAPPLSSETDTGYRRRSAGMSYLANLGVGQGSMDPQPSYDGQVNSQQVPPPPSGQMYQGQYAPQQQQWASQQGQQQVGSGQNGGWQDMPPPLPPSLVGRDDWRQ